MITPEIRETFLTKVSPLLANTSAHDHQIDVYLCRLHDQVKQVQQFQGKEPPIGGRKYYLLTCLSRLLLDCASLYVAFGSLERLQALLEYWQPEPLPHISRTATPWEYVTMQLLQADTKIYRLIQRGVAGTEYAWKRWLRGALSDLLQAIEQCAFLLGSGLEQRLQRVLDGLPVIPAAMQCLGTGLVSWLFLHQDTGGQKRIVLLEGGDGNFVSLLRPKGETYGQVYALVCEERDRAFEGRELPSVPYEQPLLLGEGRLGYELEISPLPHACWLLADEGSTDLWDQDALHQVDYRYSHLLFLPLADTIPHASPGSQYEKTWFTFDVTARGQVSVISKNWEEALGLVKDSIANLACDDPDVPLLDLRVDDCW